MKKIGIIVLLLLTTTCFYKINELNYRKHNEIKKETVEHPENLPEKNTAKNTSFGFKNLRADIYRLQTIQYIGGNVLGSDYKKYLFIILDLITELNPYFEHPYIIGELLLPDYNERYEKLNKEEQDKYINQGEEIGLKGINNFCDSNKIELIKSENNLEKIWTDEKYKNPCKTYSVGYYLAYLYYFYKKDPVSAASFYKIASANEDSPKGAKTMAAIMQGKGGNREKSYFMFLNLSNYTNTEDKVCLEFAGNLNNIGQGVFNHKNIKLDEKLIQTIEELREKVFGKFSEEEESNLLSDMMCGSYVNKAIREINLAYIEEANERFKKDNEGEPAFNAKELFDNGYIKFLPTDFQQYKDYGIIYEYNNEIGNFDYTMGTY